MKKKMSSGLIVVMLLVGLLSFQPHELEPTSPVGWMYYGVCLAAAYEMASSDCFGVPVMIHADCWHSAYASHSETCLVFLAI